MFGHDIIVIGASAGGIKALGAIVGVLPADINATPRRAQETLNQPDGALSEQNPYPTSPEDQHADGKPNS